MTNQDNFKKLEGMLYSVPMLKAELENLKIDKEELEEVEAFKSFGDSPKPSTPTYAVNSPVESEVLRRDDLLNSREYIALTREINAIERKLNKIYNIVDALDEKEQLLIRMRYFEHKSVESIMYVLGYASRRGFDKKKRSILARKLLPLYSKSFKCN